MKKSLLLIAVFVLTVFVGVKTFELIEHYSVIIAEHFRADQKLDSLIREYEELRARNSQIRREKGIPEPEVNQNAVYIDGRLVFRELKVIREE
jgi:hypothetical protein